MVFARIVRRVLCCGIAASLLVGCAQPSIVGDGLVSGGVPTTEFSGDDESVTLSARFDAALAADRQFMVEWLFPNGEIYLRKPVGRSPDTADLVETSLPIRGKAPARHPGIWHVRLWRGGPSKCASPRRARNRPGRASQASPTAVRRVGMTRLSAGAGHLPSSPESRERGSETTPSMPPAPPIPARFC